MKNERRILTIVLVFCMLLQISVVGVDLDIGLAEKSKFVEDPYSLMYDSDEKLAEELEKMSDFISVEPEEENEATEINPSFSKAMMDDSELTEDKTDKVLGKEKVVDYVKTGRVKDIKTLDVSDNVKSTVNELNEKVKGDRYIVKYKSKSKEDLSSLLSKEKGSTKILKSNRSGKMETLILDEKVNPKEFAKTLQNAKAEKYIEYIQPDYKLEFAALEDNSELKLTVEKVETESDETEDAKVASDSKKTDVDKELPTNESLKEDNNVTKEKLAEAVDSKEEENNKKKTAETLEEEPGSDSTEVQVGSDIEKTNEELEENNENETELAEAVDSEEEEDNKEKETLEDSVIDSTEVQEDIDIDIEKTMEEVEENLDEIIIDKKQSEVVVAVIDTGIDVSHDGLLDSIWKNTSEIADDNIDNDGNGFVDDVTGWDFYKDSNSVYDESIPMESAHGTHVAGIIASEAEEYSVKIMPLKVFGESGAYTSDIIDAIEYAEANGAKIVNCSFGSTDNNPALREAIENSNMLFVCSVGNARSDLDMTPIYPACFDLDNIISVTSTNEDGGLSYYSNYSENMVDVAALGRDVLSALPNGEYGKQSGTSMSTAQVSSVAAATLSIQNNINADSLKQRLINTSDMLSNLQDTVIDGRQINFENAVNHLVQTDIKENKPVDDFDVKGYHPTQDDLYQLFSNSGDMIQVDAGDHFSLVLKENGTVWAWGNNYYGQLGNGSTTNSSVPVQVLGLTDVISVVASYKHSMALKSDGTVWTWGYNKYGQLGDGTTIDSSVPVQVTGLSNVVEIDSNYKHSMALKSDGTVCAWGYNKYGQLGNGTITNSSVPVQVMGLSDVVSVTAGYNHTLALKSDETVWAWGDNYYGQFGNGSTTSSSLPVQVLQLSDLVSVVASYKHSMVLKSDGTVWTWGYNRYGQLGNGSITNSSVPVQVLQLSELVAIDSSYKQSLALKSDGTVWAWGYNEYGQLGNDSITNSSVAVQVIGLTEVVDVNAGHNHSLALKSDGTVWAWGYNEYGQLGDRSTTNRSVPVHVIGLTEVVDVNAGYYHSLALKSDGTIWAWGNNYYGQLGDGTTIDSRMPVQVGGLTDVVDIAVSYRKSMALKADGTVWAWGYNEYGQLGDGTTTDSSEPVQVTGLSNVVEIASNYMHSMALKSDGTVWAWGYNEYGQLGNGTTTNSSVPVQVIGLSDVVSVTAGYNHILALKSDGTVWAWGDNYYGQFGNGSTTSSSLPVQVLQLSDLVSVVASYKHSMALKSDGTVWTWGYNRYGQLGNGSTTNSSMPVQVTGLNNVVEIDSNYQNSLALKSDGTVWAWGYNKYGQLGNGSTTNSSVPMQVIGLTDGIGLGGGHHHSLALKADGTVWAWGEDLFKQLGSKQLTFSTPIQSQAYLSEVWFISESYSVQVPTSGSTTSTVMAEVKDSFGYIVENADITYSIAETYTGVTIDSKTGVVTVTTDAVEGTVQIKAVYEELSCDTTLNITAISIPELSVDAITGETYQINLAANDVTSFEGSTFTLTYDPAVWQLTDLCALTYEKELTTGEISRTGITIQSVSSGQITFAMDKTIVSGKQWSGVINIFEFKALASGSSQISVT